MAFWTSLAVSLLVSVVAYLLRPQPKRSQPSTTRDFEGPTAEAGRPIPVVFGSKTVKGPNVLWYGDKNIEKDEIDA